ncbi:MAG: glycosyl transferase group 1 [Verrucomicrobia bacterium]|nr:glycosyl transferase group 1 [Verrucomicrobiota bacterium]
MTGPILLDLTHTSHTQARTGVQRVVRALHRELGARATPITFDPYRDGWRGLETWEQANLAGENATGKRGAQWPLAARWRGKLKRLAGSGLAPIEKNAAGFLTAEIFSARVGARVPQAFPRVAVFHDAIALRFPELTPSGTVGRFPAYLRELLTFDGVAAVSEDSRDALVDYWAWLGASNPPPVVAIPLGVDAIASAPEVAGAEVIVLSVGTLEGRKNHLSLFAAAESLWARGEKFQLRVVGSVQAETGQAALVRLRSLQAAGWPLRYDGALPDAEVAAAYAESTFTVYPSFVEGFGLPIIESLARGRPCICSGHGALGELSRQGGCIPLESVDTASLAGAIGALIRSPADRARLSAEARARIFKSWGSYAEQLTEWMGQLK